MVSEYIQYVHEHPPRCIAGLNPKPTLHFEPTLRLPPHLTVYYGQYDVADTVSFVIGCPCGNRAVYLLGYFIETGGRHNDSIFVGPLSLECPKCGLISEFFDTRQHGYDGEQGINTHTIGEGKPDKFACPHCGEAQMIVSPNFCYQGAEDFQGEMQERLQEFFGGFDVVGQCTRCNALVEITSFECA